MFDRVKHLLSGYKKRLEEDPNTRYRALLLSGTLLIIEGTLGVVRNGIVKKGSGLIGATSGIIFGFILIWVGNIFNPSISDAIRSEAVITSFEEVNEGGQRMYSPKYTYFVDGKEYSIRSQSQFGSMPIIGETVTIEFSSRQPEYAYRIDGFDWIFNNAFAYGGWLILISSFLALSFNIILISFGVYLIMLARKSPQANLSQGIFSSIWTASKEILSGSK